MTHDPVAPGWTCTTCRVGIRHRPTIHVGLAFCCAGCVAGGPCICSYDEPDADQAPELSRTLELAVVD